MPSGESADSMARAGWSALCERFIEIKLSAFRLDLAKEWRALASANPDTPGLLAEWEQLEATIAEQNARDGAVVVRGWDWQEGRTFETAREQLYTCPAGRCDREMSAPPGLPPRCDLFGREMKVQAPGSSEN